MAEAPQRGRPVTSAEADAAERTRRILEAQNPPLRRRGPLAPGAAAQAESCARSLRPGISLLANSSVPLDEQTLRTFLTGQGLTEVAIGRGLVFAAATGEACVYGSVAADGSSDWSIGPRVANGACRP